MLKNTYALVALLLLSSCSATNAHLADPDAAFSELRALEGGWRREGTTGEAFRIEFELVAGGSALLETWYRGERKHSLTVYHVAGDRVMATHYCPQKNQPRLLLTAPAPNESSRYRFEFLDATNLSSQSSHQRFLEFDLSDLENGLTRSETYRAPTGDKASSLTLERIEGPPRSASHERPPTRGAGDAGAG